MTRTPDLLITNQLLYRLSYTSAASIDRADYSTLFPARQHLFSKKSRIVRRGAGKLNAGGDTMLNYADLSALLRAHAGARGYYEELPAAIRAALRRQQDIVTFAELQSFVSDERERV